MIPSERCFISLGCGLALIALLLKQRRQKERAPRGNRLGICAVHERAAFHSARHPPLYTEESSWRVLLLLVAGFASAPLFLEVAVEIAGNSDEPSLIVPLALVVDVAVNGCILARRHPTFCEIRCTSTCLTPCLSCRLCKNEANFLWQQTYAQTIAKEHAPTAQLLGSCSQDRFYSRLISPCSLSVSRRSRKRVCSSVPAPLRTSSLGRTLYHYRKHPAQKRQSELGTQIHRDALTCHGLPRPPPSLVSRCPPSHARSRGLASTLS